MDLKLTDKVALVTGGSSGLGRAICVMLADEGAKVAVNYLKNDKIDLVEDADVTVKMIADAGGEALAVPADLVNEDDILEMYRLTEERFGRVDILINNAAFVPKGPITSYTKEMWDYTFSVNMTGLFIAARELVARLLEDGRPGKIVNIASQAAFRGSTTGHLPYDSSKGAVVSFTRALAREVSCKGINVNAVAPGLIMTEMVAKTWEQNKERYLSTMPIARISQPEEVASVAVFLASDAASYIAGATIDVTGGMMMH